MGRELDHGREQYPPKQNPKRRARRPRVTRVDGRAQRQTLRTRPPRANIPGPPSTEVKDAPKSTTRRQTVQLPVQTQFSEFHYLKLLSDLSVKN